MSLTVGTDAYATSEEVAAYWEARNDNTFDEADEAAQDAAIRAATAYLDVNFHWVGKLADTSQLLGWPRTCAYDHERRELTGIPQRVKDATGELAKLALSGPLVSMSVGGSQGAVKREKIGAVEVEYESTSGGSEGGYSYVVALLRGIGAFKGGSGPLKVVRT